MRLEGSFRTSVSFIFTSNNFWLCLYREISVVAKYLLGYRQGALHLYFKYNLRHAASEACPKLFTEVPLERGNESAA